MQVVLSVLFVNNVKERKCMHDNFDEGKVFLKHFQLKLDIYSGMKW